MISILCTETATNYNLIKGLDLWNIERDAFYFTGSNPVITHAPCAQWSRLKGLANNNPDEKELAYHCLKIVLRNGGIFEHPNGSNFFEEVGIDKNRLFVVNQNWFGFPSQKKTFLFFHKVQPLEIPRKYGQVHIGVNNLSSKVRSKTPLSMAQYLCACIEPENYATNYY